MLSLWEFFWGWSSVPVSVTVNLTGVSATGSVGQLAGQRTGWIQKDLPPPIPPWQLLITGGSPQWVQQGNPGVSAWQTQPAPGVSGWQQAPPPGASNWRQAA